jgi:hypothetical protein
MPLVCEYASIKLAVLIAIGTNDAEFGVSAGDYRPIWTRSSRQPSTRHPGPSTIPTLTRSRREWPRWYNSIIRSVATAGIPLGITKSAASLSNRACPPMVYPSFERPRLYGSKIGNHRAAGFAGGVVRRDVLEAVLSSVFRIGGMSELRCPKCEGVMEIGHILDRTEHSMAGRALRWIAGEREIRPLGGLIFMRKPSFEITAYRCSACRYLELYTRGERKKKE